MDGYLTLCTPEGVPLPFQVTMTLEDGADDPPVATVKIYVDLRDLECT